MPNVTLTNIEKLLSQSSESLALRPTTLPEFLQAYALGLELFHVLEQKNGFYAFEAALHVFPLTGGPGTGLEAWNAASLWRNEYRDLGLVAHPFTRALPFLRAVQRERVGQFRPRFIQTPSFPSPHRAFLPVEGDVAAVAFGNIVSMQSEMSTKSNPCYAPSQIAAAPLASV